MNLQGAHALCDFAHLYSVICIGSPAGWLKAPPHCRLEVSAISPLPDTTPGTCVLYKDAGFPADFTAGGSVNSLTEKERRVSNEFRKCWKHAISMAALPEGPLSWATLITN